MTDFVASRAFDRDEPDTAGSSPSVAYPPLAASDTLSIETVTRVHHWNAHLFSFAISRPPAFRFRSGEFVMIGLQGENRPLLRAYSIASPAYADELEFLSIKVADGALTSRLQGIEAGDGLYLGRKPTGTLVTDALLGGSRLFLLATGTGLAPFLSLVRDPDIYERFGQIVLVHSARQVSDLAWREQLESHLADDPLVRDAALLQFHYVPTVTREPFRTQGRIAALTEDGRLFDGVSGPRRLDPATDRVMLCGSMAMNRDFAARLQLLGFVEGSNATPGHFVLERAFVG
jgi:ferredoxin--NADP+ reductase